MPHPTEAITPTAQATEAATATGQHPDAAPPETPPSEETGDRYPAAMGTTG
jgi:hypothetical protein